MKKCQAIGQQDSCINAHAIVLIKEYAYRWKDTMSKEGLIWTGSQVYTSKHGLYEMSSKQICICKHGLKGWAQDRIKKVSIGQ